MVLVWPPTHASVQRDTLEIRALQQVCNYSQSSLFGHASDELDCSCFTVMTECEENECENGGTCQMLAGSIICTCPPHLTGVLCELRKHCHLFVHVITLHVYTSEAQ